MSRPDSLLRVLRYPAIDGIRFYAVFAVFLVHIPGGVPAEYFLWSPDQIRALSQAPAMRAFNYLVDGHQGVDIFFVISGFLMTRVVLETPQFRYGPFLLARIRRIYPAFLVSFIASVAIYCGHYRWPFTWSDLIYGTIFANALPGVVTTNYHMVTWSLGYEFVFYLLVPIVIWQRRAMNRGALGQRETLGLMLLALALVLVPGVIPRFRAFFFGLAIAFYDDSV